jgi:hypothetical protein
MAAFKRSIERFLGLFRPEPSAAVAALGLEVDGEIRLGSGYTHLMFEVTGGVEHHLDADCRVLFTRRAYRNLYMIPFDTNQLEAIKGSKILTSLIRSLDGTAAHGKLFVSGGTVEHVSLVSATGSEIDWTSQSISTTNQT